MKTKEIRELRKKSDIEIQKELTDCQEALFKMRFKKVVEEVADTTALRKMRRKIALVKTLIREPQLEAAKKS